MAVQCANVVLRLHALRHCADGAQHGRAALVQLQELVDKLPALPLSYDPFCRDKVVEIAGTRAASAHAAVLAIARHTWDAAQLGSLENGTATEHQDQKGQPYTRVTFATVRRAPTEVDWTPEVWRQVSDRLGKRSALDRDTIEAELSLETNLARRKLKDRFGVPDADSAVLAPERDERAPPVKSARSTSQVELSQESGEERQRPATEEAPPEIDQEAQALALLFQHPDWTIAQIAESLKVDRKTPYKWKQFREAAEKCSKLRPRGRKERLPRRGHKTRDGQIEAYASEEDG